MTVTIPEPGSIRSVNYHARRDENGRYPVTYWGTLEEQLADATAENLKAHSSVGHHDAQLYSFVDDCPHSNPEEAEKYEGVDDELDAWRERNLAGLTWKDGSLYYKNEKRARGVIPLLAEYEKAHETWENCHTGSICLLMPMGTYCPGCDEYADDMAADDGIDPYDCRRQDDAKEAQDQFWQEYGEVD